MMAYPDNVPVEQVDWTHQGNNYDYQNIYVEDPKIMEIPQDLPLSQVQEYEE